MKKTGIAMIGCGAISGIYVQNISTLFRELSLMGVCDIVPERAERAAKKAEELTGKRPVVYADMYQAFEDPAVDIVLNITRPYEHYLVTREALLHGKNVYSEKPLGISMDEANELISIAEKNGLRLGGAPDTFMGAGIQTARRLLDDGIIGDIIGANCAMIGHGPETWHPDPEFFYKNGGGPMLDMGPYYTTALVNLLGEAKGVVGMTKRSFDERIITSEPHYGEHVSVETDTYLAGTILFSSGAIAQLFTTFDVYYAPGASARFEVYGTKGTMVVPDPNTFGGPVLVLRPEDRAASADRDPASLGGARDFYRGYREMPLMYDYCVNSRGLGLADMAKSLESGRPFRANYTQQRHVLEIMTSFSRASREGAYIPLTTRFERARPMLNNPMHGILES